MAQLDEIERRVSGPCELLKLEDCGHAPFRDQPEKVVARRWQHSSNRLHEERRHRHRADLVRARHEPFLPAPARAAVSVHQGRARRVVRGARLPGGAVLHAVGAVPAARRVRRRPLRRARVLLGGVALLRRRHLRCMGMATSYAMLALGAALTGIGNSVFHPADFAILNARVSAPRLGYAFSAHGVVGYIGYAVAPVFSVAIGAAYGWQAALLAGAALGVALLVLLLRQFAAPADRGAARGRKRPRSAATRACCSPGRWCCVSSTSPCSPAGWPACRASASRRWSSSTASRPPRPRAR